MPPRREFNTAHPCLMPRHEHREWPHVPEPRRKLLRGTIARLRATLRS